MRKQIKGYDEVYSIDENGNIFRNGIKMSPVNNGIGYLQIKLRKNKKRYNRYIHRLVWETFNGEIPKGLEINHINHDKSNNSLENLELVSHSDNLKRAFKKYGYFGSMNRPKSTLILSQTESTLSEGAETTGEVQSS